MLQNCLSPFQDCNDDESDGCEADTSSNRAHCSGCNKACRFLNVVSTTCSSSKCSWQRCAPGFDNCDGNRDNGCETALVGCKQGDCGCPELSLGTLQLRHSAGRSWLVSHSQTSAMQPVTCTRHCVTCVICILLKIAWHSACSALRRLGNCMLKRSAVCIGVLCCVCSCVCPPAGHQHRVRQLHQKTALLCPTLPRPPVHPLALTLPQAEVAPAASPAARQVLPTAGTLPATAVRSTW
jgi:hypothetical protein